MGKRYLYRDRILYIKAYQSVNNVNYAPFFIDLKGYARLFLFRGELFIRQRMEDAQADLDAFAQKRGLREAKAK